MKVFVTLYENLYLGLQKTIYYGFRLLADVYLYFTQVDGNYALIEKEWLDKNGNNMKLYKLKSSNHIRYFIMTDMFQEPKFDSVNWDEVIEYGNNILACLIETNNGGIGTDITENLKKFSHYILYNDFLTVDDFTTVFNLEKDESYKFTIIYSNLEEKQVIVEKNNSLKWVLSK